MENQLKSFTFHSLCGYVINAAFKSLTNCLWLHKKLVLDQFWGEKKGGKKDCKMFSSDDPTSCFMVRLEGLFRNFLHERINFLWEVTHPSNSVRYQ